MEKWDALKIITTILSRLKIRFALIGAYALSAWGAVRATKDVDMLVDISSQNLEDIITELKKAHFNVEHRPGNHDDPIKGIIRITFISSHGDEVIDLISGIKKLPQEVFDHIIELTISGYKIPVLSPEDLIITKLLAGSPLDIQDAQSVLNVLSDKIDHEYLLKTCRNLKLPVKKLHI